MPLHLPATRFSPSEQQYQAPPRSAPIDSYAQPSLPRLTLLGKPKTPPTVHEMPKMPPLPQKAMDLYPPQPPFLGSRGRSDTGSSSIYVDSNSSGTNSRKSSIGAGSSPASSRSSSSGLSITGIESSRSPSSGWKPPYQTLPQQHYQPAAAPPLFKGPIDWSLEYSPAPNPFFTPAPEPQPTFAARPERMSAARPPPLRVRKDTNPPVQPRQAATALPVEKPIESPRESMTPRRLESRYFREGTPMPKTPKSAMHAKSHSYLPMSPATKSDLTRQPTVRAVSAPSTGDLIYDGDAEQPPATPGEISLVWQHASLLFHNNRATEALSTFQGLQSRRGIPAQVMARVALNIGIISTSLAHAASDPRNTKPAHLKKEEAEEAYYQATEAFHGAVNRQPGGLIGAAGTFLLGCALFDAKQPAKAADCFEMCESVFVTEGWAPEEGQRFAPSNEEVDLAPIGIKFVLRLRDVRANYRVCADRAQQPQAPGVNRSLIRIADDMLAETFEGEDLRSPTSNAPIPIEELEESGHVGSIDITLCPKVSPMTKDDMIGGPFSMSFFQTQMVADAPVSPPTPAGAMPKLPQQYKAVQPIASGPPLRPSRPGDPLSVRQNDKSLHPALRGMTAAQQKAAEAERARKKRDRQTRLLIKLGDLRLNKPLPPLPAGARESDWRHVPRGPLPYNSNIPPVPKLPTAHTQMPRNNPMKFV